MQKIFSTNNSRTDVLYIYKNTRFLKLLMVNHFFLIFIKIKHVFEIINKFSDRQYLISIQLKFDIISFSCAISGEVFVLETHDHSVLNNFMNIIIVLLLL